jgi:ureidoglycolate lyase
MATRAQPAGTHPAPQRERLTLDLTPATPENLAPFGWIIGPVPEVPAKKLNFYNGVIRKPTQFVSDAQTELSVVTLERRPMQIQWIERHWKHTQSFVSLGAKPFVVAMAPPSDGELPPLAAIKAFLFDGSAGFCMKIGCWHEFPFAVVDRTDLLIILRSETVSDLQRIENGEAFGEDLDKKNLVTRTGTVVEIRL